MHRILLASLLVLCGCQGIVGPAQRRALNDRVDHPCLTIDEQERKAHSRLAYPEGPAYGPRTYAEPPWAPGY